MTGPELEQQFCDCASLFLARITAWFRISYQFGTCLSLQLRAIRIFVSSTSGRKFLSEFLEVGGMLTVLEVLSAKKATEEDRLEALHLLIDVTKTGRQCKELLCESNGVRCVARCLAQSSSTTTQDTAQRLLFHLFQGNPHYQSQVYKSLISLLTASSSNAQRLAASTLREVQPQMGVVSASIVEPSLTLLRNFDLAVQHEACELIRELSTFEEVQHPIMTGLINLLRPGDQDRDSTTQGADKRAPLPVLVQQAGACKVLRLLASNYGAVQELIEMRVVPHLLHVIGNASYPDSQRQASLTLKAFASQDEPVKKEISYVMGDALFERFWTNTEEFYNTLSESQIDVLQASLLAVNDLTT
jgi:hypothetical protein